MHPFSPLNLRAPSIDAFPSHSSQQLFGLWLSIGWLRNFGGCMGMESVWQSTWLRCKWLLLSLECSYDKKLVNPKLNAPFLLRAVGVRGELPVTNKQTLELTAYQKSLIASFCPCHILPIVFWDYQFLLCTTQHLYLIFPENKTRHLIWRKDC